MSMRDIGILPEDTPERRDTADWHQGWVAPKVAQERGSRNDVLTQSSIPLFRQ